MIDEILHPKVTRWLRWFDVRSGNFVGEAELKNITLEELQVLFSESTGNLMYDCFRVRSPQVERLEFAIGNQIDINKFEYFVEADASDD